MEQRFCDTGDDCCLCAIAGRRCDSAKLTDCCLCVIAGRRCDSVKFTRRDGAVHTVQEVQGEDAGEDPNECGEFWRSVQAQQLIA